MKAAEMPTYQFLVMHFPIQLLTPRPISHIGMVPSMTWGRFDRHVDQSMFGKFEQQEMK
jgi:hypothetical protein